MPWCSGRRVSCVLHRLRLSPRLDGPRASVHKVAVEDEGRVGRGLPGLKGEKRERSSHDVRRARVWGAFLRGGRSRCTEGGRTQNVVTISSLLVHEMHVRLGHFIGANDSHFIEPQVWVMLRFGFIWVDLWPCG